MQGWGLGKGDGQRELSPGPRDVTEGESLGKGVESSEIKEQVGEGTHLVSTFSFLAYP